jgi:hypothetical protein
MRKLILSLAALSVMALATPLAANADPVVVAGHHHHWWHHDHDKTVIIKHDPPGSFLVPRTSGAASRKICRNRPRARQRHDVERDNGFVGFGFHCRCIICLSRCARCR